jgi:hypothetical protein
MQTKFVKAFGAIQELFQQLNSEGKIAPEQAELFDQSQKDIINYHSWVQIQLEGNIKVELPWSEPEFTEAWKLWRDFKKQQFRFTYKPIGEKEALSDLEKISNGDMQTAILIIKKSIQKGWMGLFELKEQKTITKRLVNQKPGQILQSDNTKEYDGWD